MNYCSNAISDSLGGVVVGGKVHSGLAMMYGDSVNIIFFCCFKPLTLFYSCIGIPEEVGLLEKCSSYIC